MEGLFLNKTKVFFLPYAGGSSSVYLSWKRYLSSNIELVAIELAGRGRRMKEPLYSDVNEAVEDIYSKISQDIETSRYALFGHSMGTVLAYELTRKIKENNGSLPCHIFFSGRCPPYVKSGNEDLYLLPDDEFIRKVFEYGGMKKETASNEDIMKVFLPVLRSDYKMIELYEHEGPIHVHNCNITILRGMHDPYAKYDKMIKWKECAGNDFNMYEFDDAHFFIHKYKEDICKLINFTLG